MIYGFTGTQRGMTPQQKGAVRSLLAACSCLHHGCCIGADRDAHLIAVEYGIDMVLHPPLDPKKEASLPLGSGAVMIWERKPYLDRNQDIVDETAALIATPKGYEEELRSGTWATIRYAKKRGKPILLILPDGALYRE